MVFVSVDFLFIFVCEYLNLVIFKGSFINGVDKGSDNPTLLIIVFPVDLDRVETLIQFKLTPL